ncbi:MAG TPA: TRAP transporter fused permease subunit [bacterium]|nr:TRAP transporter fused permease subunit [bacterium]
MDLRKIGLLIVTGNPRRELDGFWASLYKLIAISLTLFMLYLAGPNFLGMPSVGWKKGAFILAISIMIFLRYSPTRKPPSKAGPNALDIAFVAAAILSFAYWAYYYEQLVLRSSSPIATDILFAVLAVVVCLEMTRRTMGLILPLMAIASLLYARYGFLVPGLFKHPGYSWATVVSEMYSVQGIFGVVFNVSQNHIAMFLIFGGFLLAFGARQFFVDFPYSLTSGMVGGPAKCAVVASSFFGMISGSATANVMATGTFTIPLMKRNGYPPHIAAAIEPTASTVGLYMPPIMGAGAFLIAEFTGIPYRHIMAISVAPALIYAGSVFLITHLEAQRVGISRIPPDARGDWKKTLKEGWYYLFTPLALLVVIMKGLSPARAVFISLVILIASYSIAELVFKRVPPRKYLQNLKIAVAQGLYEGADACIGMCAVVGTVGMIVAVVFFTGAGVAFTSMIVSSVKGMLLPTLLITFVACYVLGMGLVVTSAFILVSVMVVPSLSAIGVDPLVANLVAFWYASTSNISPPVCMAAFAAANIAEADPYKTGFTALKYSAYVILLPITFVYTDILMLNGFSFAALVDIAFIFISIFPYAGAIVGYFMGPLKAWERVALLTSSVLLIHPHHLTGVMGVVVFLLMGLWQAKKFGLNDDKGLKCPVGQ